MITIDVPDNIKTCNTEHLEIVSVKFRSYFNEDTLHISWYRDPSNREVDPNDEKAKELAEIEVSNAMKLAFNNKTDKSSFWFSLHDSYSLLSKKTSIIFVQFAITYLCEAGFSDLACIKTKSRKSLHLPCSVQDGAEYQKSLNQRSQCKACCYGEYNTLCTDYVDLE